MHRTPQLICTKRLREHIASNLAAFAVHKETPQGRQRAAVALTVVDLAFGPDLPGMEICNDWSGDAALVLTRRAFGLANHAGQWALPGGRLDAGENAAEAALRELAEEVGLHLEADCLLGRLDDFVTRSGFVVTPIVVWGGANIQLRPDPAEVSSVHRVPLTELLRADAPILEETPESPHPILLMPVGNSWIAAPTAALLYQFREVALLGRGTRVGHYEQPRFAWR
jgi:8-oxo-dGTP pyrophosphatase MutT (NUDIX family)